MLDDSVSDFASPVRLPGKSGAGGGILAVMPGRFGAAVWPPGLDARGNSIAGKQDLEWLTTRDGESILWAAATSPIDLIGPVPHYSPR